MPWLAPPGSCLSFRSFLLSTPEAPGLSQHFLLPPRQALAQNGSLGPSALFRVGVATGTARGPAWLPCAGSSSPPATFSPAQVSPFLGLEMPQLSPAAHWVCGQRGACSPAVSSQVAPGLSCQSVQ